VSLDVVLTALAAAEQRILNLEEQRAITLGDQKKPTMLRGKQSARPEVSTRGCSSTTTSTSSIDTRRPSTWSAPLVEHSGLRTEDDAVLVDWGGRSLQYGAHPCLPRPASRV